MPTKAGPLRILVTDANTRAGLGAVRSLGRAGHVAIAGYPGDATPPASCSSRYCGGSLRHPDPRSEQFAFRDWIRERARHGVLDAVLPVTEASLVGVAAVRRELPTEFLPIMPSDSALEYTLSKFLSTRMAVSLEVPCPQTVFIADGTTTCQWQNQVAGLQFPIVIKTDNYLTAEGAYEHGRNSVAANLDEAERLVEESGRLSARVIAQELIPGGGAGAFLLRFRGETHLSFAHRRLHEVPYTGGWSSFRESCHDEELVRLGESLLDAIQYDGVAMVEFRRNARDGKPYFLEINGRLWGSIALALHCGVDFPAALVDCHQYGRAKATQPRYRAGIKCRNVYPGEVGHLLSILRARARTGGGATPSKSRAAAKFVALLLDPRIRHDYLWWSDPLPGVRQAWGMVAMLGRKILKTGYQVLERHRGRSVLKRLRREHRLRCAQPQYFQPRLSRIMFLCQGNICRSAFAAAYWNRRVAFLATLMPVAVSAGLDPRNGRRTPLLLIEQAGEYGVDLTTHRSERITRDVADSVDAIFVMDRANYRRLVALFPWVTEKTYLLGVFADNGRSEIDDPYNKDRESALSACRHLASALDGLMNRMWRP